MDLFKFTILYLYKLIISNLFKISLIVIAFVLWKYAGTLPSSKENLLIVDSLHVDNQYQYMYKKADENEIKYFIYNSDHPIKLSSGKITILKENEFNTLLYIALIIDLVILVGIMFAIKLMYESEGNQWAESSGVKNISWSTNEAFDYALSWFVECEVIPADKSGPIPMGGNFYYYYAFGKLVSTSTILKDHFSVDFELKYLQQLSEFLI